MLLAEGRVELILLEEFRLGEEKFFIELFEFKLKVFLGSFRFFKLQLNYVGGFFCCSQLLFDGFVIVFVASDNFFVVGFLSL